MRAAVPKTNDGFITEGITPPHKLSQYLFGEEEGPHHGLWDLSSLTRDGTCT